MNIKKIKSGVRRAFLDTIIAATIICYSCEKEPIDPPVIIPPDTSTGIMYKDVINKLFDKGYKFSFWKPTNKDNYNPTSVDLYDANMHELIAKGNIINWDATIKIAYVLGNKNLGDSAKIFSDAFKANQMPSVVIADADKKTPNQVAEEVISYLKAAKYLK